MIADPIPATGAEYPPMSKNTLMVTVLTLALAVILGTGDSGLADDSGWVPLFDGKTLDGWKVNGGTASYKVADGVIVGTTVEGSPNTFLVQGNRYRSWINGIAASDLTDDVDKAGFIGLQVHGIAKDQGPYQVCWRNVRIKELKPGEEVSFAEPPEGFKAVFNGRDLTGWEGSPTYWSVEDGCLTGKADGTPKFNRFIVWRGGTVRNFELRVKVKRTFS
jgi:hypothetical protein